MRDPRFWRALVFGIVTVAAGTARAMPAHVDRSMLAPIDALVVAMNRGDDRALAALMTADAVIQDEVAPYRWTGPDAEKHWSRDDGMLIRERAVTASHSTAGKPTFAHHDSNHAFVMVPLSYDYARGGKPQHERGLWTIVLVKRGAVWKIDFLGFAKIADTSDSTWDD